jgi:hypothetical protein
VFFTDKTITLALEPEEEVLALYLGLIHLLCLLASCAGRGKYGGSDG